jgi:hypothetical protein
MLSPSSPVDSRLQINPPHPQLPAPVRPYSAADITAFGRDRGPGFYQASLCYAQSLWCQGYPAQSLLQLNRAFSCVLPEDEPVLADHPWPYAAMAWILRHAPADQCLGNPRRHWQHLATRMVQPHRTLRTWRAWSCWWLACQILPATTFPADSKQLTEEGIAEPTLAEISTQLRQNAGAAEHDLWWPVQLEVTGSPKAENAA